MSEKESAIIGLECEHTRVIYHITAGDRQWTPTKTELDDLASQFRDAKFDADGVAVVATRNAVKVTTIIPY